MADSASSSSRRPFSIGRLSAATEVKVETIRYYERIGLLPIPARTEGGHRLYSGDQLRRLVFIRRARELGFSLEDVRTLLAMVDAGGQCGEFKQVAERHLAEIKGRIADLRRLQGSIRATVARCEGGEAEHCPIIDALYAPALSGVRDPG